MMPRDPRVLARQAQEIEAYWASCWPDADEAASLAPGGSVLVLGGAARTRRDARHTVVTHAKLDSFPLHVRLYAFVALRQLPPDVVRICQMVYQRQQPHRAVARALHCHEKTIYNKLRYAKETAARMLWNDAGAQTLPPQIAHEALARDKTD